MMALCFDALDRFSTWGSSPLRGNIGRQFLEGPQVDNFVYTAVLHWLYSSFRLGSLAKSGSL